MKIATWNVNSIRARLPRVLAWLERAKPDIACIQETKVEDGAFPRAEIEAAGYRATIFGQKTYNGVAFLSREDPLDVVRGFPDDGPEDHKRLIAATYGGVRVVNVYVPNGESTDSEKFPFKLRWLEKLRAFLATGCNVAKPLVLCGDFNIAPDDRDVHDPEKWKDQVLCHPKERAALAEICKIGLKDAQRLLTEEGKLFTWWDYRGGAFPRGLGLRIDLHLVSRPLEPKVEAVEIDVEERKGTQPSDHAPVILRLR